MTMQQIGYVLLGFGLGGLTMMFLTGVYFTKLIEEKERDARRAARYHHPAWRDDA